MALVSVPAGAFQLALVNVGGDWNRQVAVVSVLALLAVAAWHWRMWVDQREQANALVDRIAKGLRGLAPEGSVTVERLDGGKRR